MSSSREQLVESVGGDGEVYDEGKFVSKVSYSLSVYQTAHTVDTPNPTDVEGLKTIKGRITVLDTNVILGLADIHALHLKDTSGRKLNFTIQRPNYLTNTYFIVGYDAFYT